MSNQEEPLYLNNDVIEQILIHVPESSLLRFQLVCKNWRDMIQEPRFKKEHFKLNNTTNEPLRLLVLKSWVINSGVICEKTFVAEVDSQSREIWIPRDLGNDGHFGGSCNGLLCTEVKGEITVFNPITREVVYLPKPTFIQGSGLNYEYERMYTDFLFHNATGEYKVILFYQNCIMQLCAVHIYTLGANTSWRQVGNIGIFPSDGGVNVEDTVYWPACSLGYNGMIFFNLSEENINFIYFPINNRMLLGLTKWHGKVCDVYFQMEHRRIEFRIHSNSVEGPIAPSYEIQLQYGRFTVQRAYQIMANTPTIRSTIHRIWKLTVPPRFKVFGWLVLHNRILTAENLRIKGFHIVGMCYMCRRQDETIQHLFNECLISDRIYRGVMAEEQIMVTGRDRLQLITDNAIDGKTRALTLVTHFVIWRERCNRIFREKSKPNEMLIQESRTQWRASAMRDQDRVSI